MSCIGTLQPPEEIAASVRQFVIETANVDAEKATLDSRLSEDLGITGDDADELMGKYFKRFRVDPEGFLFLDHFDWEAAIVLAPTVIAVWRFLSKRFDTDWRAARARESDLTIRHLAVCAANGRWLRPPTVEVRPRQGPATRLAQISFSAILAAFFVIIGVAFPTLIGLAGVGAFIAKGDLMGIVFFVGAGLFIWMHLHAALRYARVKTRAPSEAARR